MMWTDWTYWLSTQTPDALPWLLAPLLFFDAIRYAVSGLLVWIWDFPRDVIRWIVRGRRYDHGFAPSVGVLIVGHNEADTIGHTLDSVWGTYPDLEIIVVDDGSQDGMADVADAFAETHEGVTVLRRPERGGKSAALNLARRYTKAEILVYIDSDGELAPGAVREVVQPLRDPSVGAVSGTVLGRNSFTNLVTWAQSLEYLHCIFLGRMFSSRLGILGIVSGAFGAYRCNAVDEVGGFDVGPGEDGDLTLRLRKAGYDIGFAPYAQCFTNLPTTLLALIQQRRRWEWALVTHECRKHIDLANVFSRRFRFLNLFMLSERWTYNLALQVMFWSYLVWAFQYFDGNTWQQVVLYYLGYVSFSTLTTIVTLYYSRQPWRDLVIGLATPVLPFYFLMLRVVMTYSVLEEFFTRRSHRDNFVPTHVRAATWEC